MTKLIAALWLVFNLAAAAAWAQPFPFNEAGVTMGHWHLNSSDVEANKKIFVGMGGIFLKRRRRPRAEYRRAFDLRGLHHARVRYDLDDQGGQEHQSGRATDQ